MTQKQAINAYKVLENMSGAELPVHTAYKLYQMRRVLEPVFAFRVEQERTIIQKFHGTEADGSIVFKTTEDLDGAQKALNELDALEMETEVTPIRLKAEDFDKTHLSMNDIAALDGFVLFG